jgi:hypothetical protein
MRNLCKALIVAVAASAACGVMVPKASAQMAIQTTTTTYPAANDYSLSNPGVLTQAAVIESSPVVAPTVITGPAVMSAPAVINTFPLWDWRPRPLLYGGLPLHNFRIFRVF